MRMLLAAVLVLMCSAGGPSIDSGRASDTEVFVFGSYFCSGSRAVEPFLREELASLHKAGVKVTFVDMPANPQTMLFARYFQYAARAVHHNFSALLRIRKTLFEIAQWRYISELKLQSELKRRRIAMTVFEPQRVYDHWQELIARYDVQDTPTVVRLTGSAVGIFSGEDEIRAGIERIKAEALLRRG